MMPTVTFTPEMTAELIATLAERCVHAEQTRDRAQTEATRQTLIVREQQAALDDLTQRLALRDVPVEIVPFVAPLNPPIVSWRKARIVAETEHGGTLVTVTPLMNLAGIFYAILALRFDADGRLVGVVLGDRSYRGDLQPLRADAEYMIPDVESLLVHVDDSSTTVQ